jgi:hypothetical protein
MHAHVVHVEIQDVGEAIKGLEESVIPNLKQAPGFIGAYFVAVDDSHGVSVAVFDTEEQARTAAPPKGEGSAGVTMTNVQVGPVVGSA